MANSERLSARAPGHASGDHHPPACDVDVEGGERSRVAAVERHRADRHPRRRGGARRQEQQLQRLASMVRPPARNRFAAEGADVLVMDRELEGRDRRSRTTRCTAKVGGVLTHHGRAEPSVIPSGPGVTTREGPRRIAAIASAGAFRACPDRYLRLSLLGHHDEGRSVGGLPVRVLPVRSVGDPAADRYGGAHGRVPQLQRTRPTPLHGAPAEPDPSGRVVGTRACGGQP
jgi:hypothetical protein